MADEDFRLAGPAGGVVSKGAVKQEEAGFRCMPCGFTTEDQAEFLAHIPSHRSSGGGDGALQCQQCGACFASGPSLSRHRFISHRVRDTLPEHHTVAAGDTDGIADGTSGEPGTDLAGVGLGSGVGSPGSSPSQQGDEGRGEGERGACVCKVCGRRFDKVSDLNTHFRTHGMAFITARKTDKPV